MGLIDDSSERTFTIVAGSLAINQWQKQKTKQTKNVDNKMSCQKENVTQVQHVILIFT